MNRAERRMMMKKFPAYRKALKGAAQEAVDNLEDMLKKYWEENDDETLNDGEEYPEDDEDEIYDD